MSSLARLNTMLRVVPLALLLCCSVAHAGAFGGFSEDESRYLAGTNRSCVPLKTGELGAPRCKKVDSRERAAAKFVRPAPIGGRGAFSASALGTQIEVRRADGAVVATWTAAGVVSRVDALFVSRLGKVVAVEFQARDLGRLRTDVVAFVVPKSEQTASATGGQASGRISVPGSGPSGKLVAKRVKRPKGLSKRLAAAQRLLKPRRYARAGKLFDQLAAKHADDAAVVFGQAAARAGLGDSARAIAALRRLGALPSPEVPVWMIEARRHRAFDKMRGNADFRRAIGLDPGERSLSSYEKVLALGGIWESPGSPCAEPKVALELDRGAKEKFSLTISSNCQGARDRTKLGGRWVAQGAESVTLVFPNPGKDETMACKLETCSDSAGQLCLACGAGTDMSFVLRAVSR